MRPLTVVAAIIESEGRILACQRRASGSFPLKWEFPGGKVRKGESPAKALRRELQEELGLRARVGAQVYRTRHRYREMSDELELIFFRASADPAAIRNLGFEQIRWVPRDRLPELDFLPADLELVRKLADGSLSIS